MTARDEDLEEWMAWCRSQDSSKAKRVLFICLWGFELFLLFFCSSTTILEKECEEKKSCACVATISFDKETTET